MWSSAVVFVLCGFLLLGRSFAYLGIPPAKVFVGEILLGAFTVLRPRDIIGRWFAAAMRPSPLNGFSIALMLFLLYGAFEFVRGVIAEYPPLAALQSFVFHFYPLYVFLGIWVGRRHPDLLARVIPPFAWVHGIYGLLYGTLLNGVWIPIPTTDVGVFGQPNGTVIAILGLMCLRELRIVDHVAMILNLMVLVSLQVRADWLALAATVVLWSWFYRKLGSLMFGCVVVLVLLCAAMMTEVEIPGPADRGGNVTAAKIVARIIAPIDVTTAKELDRSAGIYKGTTVWRTTWWDAIWAAVHRDLDSTFLGLGYGYPLNDLVPYLRGQQIRSPHNVFFYALGYTGWFGVILFFGLQAQLITLQTRVFRTTGNLFGLLVSVQALIAALFGNLFETPFGAIPVFLLLGLTAAPVAHEERLTSEHSPVAQLVPPSRW
jgi:hypothetical protein